MVGWQLQVMWLLLMRVRWHRLLHSTSGRQQHDVLIAVLICQNLRPWRRMCILQLSWLPLLQLHALHAVRELLHAHRGL